MWHNIPRTCEWDGIKAIKSRQIVSVFLSDRYDWCYYVILANAVFVLLHWHIWNVLSEFIYEIL